MAEDRLTIDDASVFDNDNERQVEFAAEVGGERRAFAAQYDLLRALAAEEPEGRAAALFRQHAARIAVIGTRALARDLDADMVVISENDLG